MIYISSTCVKKKRIGFVVEELAEAGFRYIELSGGTSYYDNIEKDLRTLQQKYNLQYACHAYFPPPKKDFVVNLASCNQEIYQRSIQHYIDCMVFLERIQCHTLSFHAGFHIDIELKDIGQGIRNISKYDVEKSTDNFYRACNLLEERAKESAIDLYFENNVISQENYQKMGFSDLFMGTTAQRIIDMKKYLQAGVLLDLGHLAVSSRTHGLSLESEINQLKTSIGWLHISDNDHIRDLHQGISEDSLLIPYMKMLKYYSGNITLETHGSLDEIKQSATIVEGIFIA